MFVSIISKLFSGITPSKTIVTSVALMAITLVKVDAGAVDSDGSKTSCGELKNNELSNNGEYGRHSNIVVNGIRLHYVENGDRRNPLMVFVHGFPELWWSWRHQLEYFAKSHWVVALDMRGYGDSEKPPRKSDYSYETLQKDIVGLVRALGRNSTILVAHDLGGLIAWGVTANYPEVISKLIILNAPHPNLWLRPGKYSSFFQLLKSWYVVPFLVPLVPEGALYAGLRVTSPGILRAPGISLFAPPFTPQELSAYKCAFPRMSSWTGPLNYYRSYIRHSLRDAVKRRSRELPNVDVPTLIIWAKKEAFLDSSVPKLTKQFADNLNVKYIPSAKHFYLSTHSNEINKLIESFV